MEGFGIHESIRHIAPQAGLETAGIGYIVIPDVEDLDRDEFVEYCYRTETICIDGGQGYGLFYDVAIDREVIKSIQFPKEKGKRGSPIVWVNIPQWQKPVIVSVLKYENDTFSNGEGELNHERSEEGNTISTNVNAKTGVVELNIMSQTNVPKLNINILSINNNGELNLFIKGKAQIHTTDEIKLISDKKVKINVIDEKGEDRCVIVYEKEVGFRYIDEFDNEINCKDGLIHINSTKINHNDGVEPMVLGTTLAKKLDQLLDAISSLTVPTALGPSGTPINTPAFKAIQAVIDEIKSSISFLD